MSSKTKAQVDTVILDLGNVLVFHDNAQLFQTFGQLAGMRGEEVARIVPKALWSAIHSGSFSSSDAFWCPFRTFPNR